MACLSRGPTSLGNVSKRFHHYASSLSSTAGHIFPHFLAPPLGRAFSRGSKAVTETYIIRNSKVEHSRNHLSIDGAKRVWTPGLLRFTLRTRTGACSAATVRIYRDENEKKACIAIRPDTWRTAEPRLAYIFVCYNCRVTDIPRVTHCRVSPDARGMHWRTEWKTAFAMIDTLYETKEKFADNFYRFSHVYLPLIIIFEKVSVYTSVCTVQYNHYTII